MDHLLESCVNTQALDDWNFALSLFLRLTEVKSEVDNAYKVSSETCMAVYHAMMVQAANLRWHEADRQ